MRARPWTVALVAAASLGLAAVVRLASSPLGRVAVPPPADAAPQPVAATPVRGGESPGGALIAHDPFRITRRPSIASYDPAGLAQPAAPPPPKPSLVLLGIVWDTGTDPAALVDGLPGADGPRPVRQGETVSGLRVTAIRRDRVLVTGLDTT
jgi:hypothetical protein